MKTTIIRSAITLIFCTFTLGGMGQGFNENFSNFTIPNAIIWAQGEIDVNGWLIYFCNKSWNGDSSNLALKVESKTTTSTPYGYAKTKMFNFVGDAKLTFSHGRTTKDNTKILLSVLNGGVFDDYNQNKEIDVTTPMANGFKTEECTILAVKESTRIKFELTSFKYFAIDDVIVTKLPEMPLNETTDKATTTSTLEANASKTVTVNTTRKLLGGIWNTLCLPFDVTMNDLVLALGENQGIQTRTFDSYNSDTKVMTFVNPFGGETPLSLIPAGTPFLIKLNSDVEDPTFHAVTISSTETQSIGEEGSVQFVGTYSPVGLNTDGTNLFITKNNTLASPSTTGNTMNGLRAYIVVPEGFDSSSARLLMDGGETTAISALAPSAETSPKATYNLKGQRVENVRRGLYVVNGKLTFVK